VFAAGDQRQAEPRGSRPRGDNPPTGYAVPRESRPVPPPAAPTQVWVPRNRVYAAPGRVYNNYYYYPYYSRQYHPYGYGAFGLGYFYYNPFTWGPRYSSGYYYSRPHYQYRSFGFDIGELQLRVDGPRNAQVYVDGYYAGVVDDFDGGFQALKLESGPHRIEIVAPGYETLAFDVRINPGQRITYRGDLRRLRP
jgi:hypothetical protein